jgi:hypothetical protein
MRIFSYGLVALVVGACSGSSNANIGSSSGGGAQTGQSCAAASSCYPGLDAGALIGQVACLTQLTNGYCTHTCTSDADCCRVSGECPLSFKEVCASFESSGQMYCFLSCASGDIASDPDAGTADANTFCTRWAGANATCRSTGGGKNNQKFCGPA